jgi:hypothetical protein
MRKTIVQLALLVIIVLAGYVALFKRDEFLGWLNKRKDEAQGYKDAKTPEEALDYFRKAIKERKFGTASKYLGGEYYEQFTKAAEPGEKLSEAIDNLRNAIQKSDTPHSDKVKLVLALLEPFPPTTVKKVVKQGDNKAYAEMLPEALPQVQLDARLNEWKLDPRMMRPLIQGVNKVELRREGEGDDAHWKIYLPVNKPLPECVDYLKEHYKGFVKALEGVKNRVKNDPTTKENLEGDVKNAIREASQ